MEDEFVAQSLIVSPQDSGIRIDHFLSQTYPVLSRQTWKNRITNKRVTLNDKKIKPAYILKQGDLIKFKFTKKIEPEVETNYSFIYGFTNPECIIAINKPPNLPVHPSGIYYKNTLTSLLTKDHNQKFSNYLLNRLDRETSGIVLFARDSKTASLMRLLFIDNKVKKEYKVWIESESKFPVTLTAIGWIGIKSNSLVRKRMYFVPDKNLKQKNDLPEFNELLEPKSCHTVFIKESEFIANDGKTITQLKVELLTGRTHQIRATLSSLGYPVVGDRLYGIDPSLYLKFIDNTETKEDLEKLRISRTALHASKISFPHPIHQTDIEINCPLPKDLLLLQDKTLNQI